MSKPAARKKKQVERDERLPSEYMFDEEDAVKNRAKDQQRTVAPAKPKPAPAREPPKFEDYYQEEELPKRSDRLFESFTTEQ